MNLTTELIYHGVHVTQAILPLLIGLIAGAAQAAGQAQQEKGQLYNKAAAERMSPWSHLPIPNAQLAPSPISPILQGGFAGLQYGTDNPSSSGTDVSGASAAAPTADASPIAAASGQADTIPFSGGAQGALAGMPSAGQPLRPQMRSLSATQTPRTNFNFSPWSYVPMGGQNG